MDHRSPTIPSDSLFKIFSKYNSWLIIIIIIWCIWILRSIFWLFVEMTAPDMSVKSIGIGLSIVLLTSLGGIALYRLRGKVANQWILSMLIFIGALLIRVGYIILFPTRPQSDYLVYHTMGLQFAQGDYHSFYARPMGYPLLLSLLYHWIPDPLAGRILNVIFSSLTVMLVYQIGYKIGDKSLGLISAYLLAVYPADIMMTSVLATEPAASFFFCFCFV